MNRIQIKIPDELKELAPNYLRKKILDLSLLKDALNRKDFEEIIKLSHKTKGTAGGYGFSELSGIAKSLEMAANSGNLYEVEAILQKMQNHLESIDIGSN